MIFMLEMTIEMVLVAPPYGGRPTIPVGPPGPTSTPLYALLPRGLLAGPNGLPAPIPATGS